MTDEQRPWQDTDEYRDFLYAAGDPSPLTFWTEERDAALTKLLARVWREGKKAACFDEEVCACCEKLDAAEAQRDRLAAALRLYMVEVTPGEWHSAQCPKREIASAICSYRCEDARAALADVPNDRAGRRDEAYRAMVEALQEMIDESGGEEPCIIERGYCRSHFGGINRGGNCPVPHANHALALARQVEEA